MMLPELGLIKMTCGNVSAHGKDSMVFAIKPSSHDYNAIKVGDMVWPNLIRRRAKSALRHDSQLTNLPPCRKKHGHRSG
ncbi:MAG: hypothetical protein HUJ51_01465 [Eggerthellaceae bacterium]|nr:hypothetical protein [Eggerthellaceae bacterium]